VPPSVAEYDRRHPLALDSFPATEAQIAALADDHRLPTINDIDDGLRAGLFAVRGSGRMCAGLPVFERLPGLPRARPIAADS